MYGPLLIGRELRFANRHCESWTAARICDSWTPYTGTSYYATGSLWPDSYVWGGKHSLYYCQSAGMPYTERFRITPDPAVYPELFHYGDHRLFAALRWHPCSGWEPGSSERLSLTVGATTARGEMIYSVNCWSIASARFATVSGGGFTPLWTGSQAVDIIFEGRASTNSATRGFVDDLCIGLDWLTVYPHLSQSVGATRLGVQQRAIDGTPYQYAFGSRRRWSIPIDLASSETWMLISSWYETGAQIVILDTGSVYDGIAQPVTTQGLYRAYLTNKANPMSNVLVGHHYLRYGVLELEQSFEVA